MGRWKDPETALSGRRERDEGLDLLNAVSQNVGLMGNGKIETELLNRVRAFTGRHKADLSVRAAVEAEMGDTFHPDSEAKRILLLMADAIDGLRERL